MLWQRDQKNDCDVSFLNYFSLCASIVSWHQKEMLNMFWALLNSDHFLSHVAFRYVVKKLRDCKKLHFAAFVLFPNISLAISLLCPLLPNHIFCCCVCRENTSDGKVDLPADFIIHHSGCILWTLCPQYATNKTSVASYTWRKDWNVTLRMTQGSYALRETGQLCCFWHAVRHPPCLPASLLHLTQAAMIGIVMSAVYEHCHWNAHWNDISQC